MDIEPARNRFSDGGDQGEIEMVAKTPNGQDMARMMIHRHGLRAEAVALEHVTETRQQGDAAALEFWQYTHAVIRELRRIAGQREAANSDATRG
jgi:hypothetical protein